MNITKMIGVGTAIISIAGILIIVALVIKIN
jgi:hypothetical protein